MAQAHRGIRWNAASPPNFHLHPFFLGPALAASALAFTGKHNAGRIKKRFAKHGQENGEGVFMLDVNQYLQNLWTQHRLGHFYILVNSDWPKDWATPPVSPPFALIAQALNVALPNVERHPDFLLLRPRKDRYTLPDLAEAGLFTFLELVAFGQGGRFIVFTAAEKLSEIILNKLLKTLENPPPQTTIFFLSTTENFPATILSRAAVLRMKAPSTTAQAEEELALGPELRAALRDFFTQARSWSFLQETLRLHPEQEAALAQWILRQMSKVEDYTVLTQLQKDWQAAEQAQALHRPSAASFYLLLTELRQHLPSAASLLP